MPKRKTRLLLRIKGKKTYSLVEDTVGKSDFTHKLPLVKKMVKKSKLKPKSVIVRAEYKKKKA